MEVMKSFVDSYLDFHYGLGLVIAVVLFGVLLCVILRKAKSQGQSISWKEILCCLTLSVYIALILGGTLLNREVALDEYRIELIPFWSYYEAVVNKDVPLALQMFYNVIVFIPWGVLRPIMWNKMRKLWTLAISAAGFSLLIEVVQLVSKLGLFEFDDIFHNVLGAVIGYGVWKVWKRRR